MLEVVYVLEGWIDYEGMEMLGVYTTLRRAGNALAARLAEKYGYDSYVISERQLNARLHLRDRRWAVDGRKWQGQQTTWREIEASLKTKGTP